MTRPVGGVLNLPTFAVDGWTGNAVDDAGVEWWVTKEEGWSSAPPVRLSLADRPERDGAFDTPSYRAPRVITLEGTAIAPGRVAAERAKDRLAAVLADGSALRPLVVTEPHGVRQAHVRLSAETRIADRRGGAFEFSLQLTAPDPLRYAAGDPRRQSCGLSAPGGGLRFPMRFPLNFGPGASGGRLTLDNAGTAPTWPVWRITGPCRDPVVVDSTTGEQLAFALELRSREWLEVDTDARTVLLQGTASRRAALLPESRWFPLRPGRTRVVFRAAEFTAATLTAQWRDAWI
ncbi:MAG TPA: hypothetical protein VHJ17_02425 [Thermomonospora sp.]|nr:hypothetical protein [Thermomonospora sp.]